MAQIEIGPPGRVVLLRARGEFDLAENECLRRALASACEQTTEFVILDCADIEFIDSSTIGLLVSFRKQLDQRGHALQLVRVPARIARILRMLGLWELLNCHEGDGVLLGGEYF